MRNRDDERPTDAHRPVLDEMAADGETVTTVVGNERIDPGTDIGGYVVDGELGKGGMGVVYSATHPVIGKRAAIKVLKPDLSNNPAAVERFVLEARAVNQIGHPNIVDIFAFGALPDGRSYYVMDLLEGEPLRLRIKRGPLHVSEAANVIDHVTSALLAAHDKGIIHRDLKPDNVFMVHVAGRTPDVRILDWGLLKLSSTQSSVSSGRYKTLAGSVMGTPVYMSPEQARASDAVDHRTDIYSLGVMAYEMLTGEVPFKKGTSIDTLLAHQDDPVPPLGPRCPGLPEQLVQLIEAMLCKDRDGRPTLHAVRAVLKRLTTAKVIPTMTAAGIPMQALPNSPFVEPPTQSHPTLDEAPRTRPSTELTAQRLPTPIPGSLSIGDLPLPAPPPTSSLQAMQQGIDMQTTLAGHSMPLARTTPIPGSIPPLSMHAHGSQPPQSQLAYSTPPPLSPMRNAPASTPPYQFQQQMQQQQQQLRAASTGSRRVLVIAAAAVVVSTLGIILLLVAN